MTTDYPRTGPFGLLGLWQDAIEEAVLAEREACRLAVLKGVERWRDSVCGGSPRDGNHARMIVSYAWSIGEFIDTQFLLRSKP